MTSRVTDRSRDQGHTTKTFCHSRKHHSTHKISLPQIVVVCHFRKSILIFWQGFDQVIRFTQQAKGIPPIGSFVLPSKSPAYSISVHRFSSALNAHSSQP